MSDEVQPRRRAVLAIVGIVVVAIVIATAWYLTSPRFHDYVRARLVERLESITGGRVEMGEVDWNLRGLSLVAHNVTIHGLEGPNEAPYVHADRVAIRLKILSLAGRKIGLRYFEVDRPVIHLIVAADGSTNQPKPKAQASSGRGMQPIFDLQADRVEVRDGVLMVNDRRVPLDLAANNVQVELAYAVGAQSYDGTLSAGGIHLAYGDYKPFDSAVAASFSVAQNQVVLKSAKLTSGKSWVEVAGQLADFNHPRLTLNYRSRLDLAQIGDITRLAQVRGGVLEVNGSGSFTAEDFTTVGFSAGAEPGIPRSGHPHFRSRRRSGIQVGTQHAHHSAPVRARAGRSRYRGSGSPKLDRDAEAGSARGHRVAGGGCGGAPATAAAFGGPHCHRHLDPRPAGRQAEPGGLGERHHGGDLPRLAGARPRALRRECDAGGGDPAAASGERHHPRRVRD